MTPSLPPRARLLALALGAAVLVVVAARAAGPLFLSAGFLETAFSPNADHVQDDAHFTFTLADSALVTVVVRQDASNAPGALVDSLLKFEPLGPGADTVLWGGLNFSQQHVPDGVYWITAKAQNATLADSVAMSVIVDVLVPRDTIAIPARVFTPQLVHHVQGEASDRNGLAHLVVTLAAEGQTLVVPLCAPCATDTVGFAIDVPDPIAATDSLRITIDAVDIAGNGKPRTTLVVVDSLPPPPPAIDPLPSPIDRDSVFVQGTASEAESVFVTMDGVAAGRTRVGSGSRFELRIRRFAQGTHTVVATSEDKAGNFSPASAPVTFVYQELLGIVLPERFQIGEYLQVNLAKGGSAVRLRIYDLSGRLVRRLEDLTPRTVYEFAWDGMDERGHPAGSGPYVVQVEADYADGSRLAKRLAMVMTR